MSPRTPNITLTPADRVKREFFSLIAVAALSSIFCLRAFAVSSCLQDFAGLAGADTPLSVETIAQTYRNLLETLGARSSPEVFQLLAEAENPLAVPEGSGEKSSALGKRLREFEVMLVQAKVRTPEAIAAFRAVAAELAGGKTVAAAKLARHLDPDLVRKFKLEEGPGSVFASPDGRWLVKEQGVDEFEGISRKLVVVDTKTGESKLFTPPRGSEDSILSLDGKHIYYANSNQTLTKVAFKNGAPEKKGTTLGTKLRKDERYNSYLAVGDETGRIYASFGSEDSSFVFLPTGQRSRIMFNGRPIEMGPFLTKVPGTDDLLWTEYGDVHETMLRRIAISDDGLVTVVKRWFTDEPELAPVVTHDDKLMYLSRKKKQVIIYPTPDSKPITLKLELPDADANANADLVVDGMAVSHAGDEGLLVLPRGRGRSTIVRLRLDTGEIFEELDVPLPTGSLDLHYSADGKYLYVGSRHDEHVERVLLR